jgi:hypothetical protein
MDIKIAQQETITELVLENQKLKQERDEWRKAAFEIVEQATKSRKELERERDEARAALPAGEWVAYEDHKPVHDAASRLLVDINKWKWMMDYCKRKGMSPTLGWGSAEEAFLKTIGKWEVEK